VRQDSQVTRWEESADNPTEPPLDDDEHVGVEDQSCAVCGKLGADWLHPLDSTKVEYRAWGSSYTLSSYWTLCGVCESLHQVGDLAGLVVRQAAHARANGQPHKGQVAGMDVVEEDFRKQIEAFNRADLGGQQLQ
jgi:hypothetical protein